MSALQPINGQQLMGWIDRQARRTQWGAWRWDRRLGVLRHRRFDYEIAVSEIRTDGQLVDWLFHVCGKKWMTPQDKSDLIEGLRSTVNPDAFAAKEGGRR